MEKIITLLKLLNGFSEDKTVVITDQKDNFICLIRTEHREYQKTLSSYLLYSIVESYEDTAFDLCGVTVNCTHVRMLGFSVY